MDMQTVDEDIQATILIQKHYLSEEETTRPVICKVVSQFSAQNRIQKPRSKIFRYTSSKKASNDNERFLITAVALTSL